MSTDLTERATVSQEIQEKVLLGGDLSKLTTAERLSYYQNVCLSLGLNPLTRPFEYLILNQKMVLYARKDCTDQLRKNDKISIDPKNFSKEVIDGVYIVTAWAATPEGRTDVATGAVPIEGLKGIDRANAMMKAETKAKRRVTLSICGLGMLDETETDTIKDAKIVHEPMLPNIPQVRPKTDTTNHALFTDGTQPRQEDGAMETYQIGEASASQQDSDAPAPLSASEWARRLAQEHAGDVPCFTFGKHKGKSPTDPSVPDSYLAFIEPVLAGYVDDPAKTRWQSANQATLDAVRAAALDRGLLNYDDDDRR